MRIVILGSGNVATQLALSLKAIGEEIVQVYSPNLTNANNLAEKVAASAISNLAAINMQAELYIISVKDDAISAVAAELNHVNGLVVHTSGTTDLSILSDQVKRAGVFYPLQTFSKSRNVSFKHIPICLEADKQDLILLRELAGKLSSKVYELDGEKRKVLHLAAVFACNFPNHLYALANQILQQHHLDFDIVRPLIAETADKVMVNLPDNVQTGPAIRGDERTMDKHLKMLSNLPELQEIYQTLSNSIKIIHK